eukprot:g38993.t1
MNQWSTDYESDDENGNEVDFNEHRAVDASDQHAEEWEALVPVGEVAEEVDLGIGMQQGKLVVPAGLLPPSHSHSDRIVLTPKAGSPVAPNRSLHLHITSSLCCFFLHNVYFVFAHHAYFAISYDY